MSSIEFQESGDRSQIVGQFVSGNCSQVSSTSTSSITAHILPTHTCAHASAQSSYGAGPRGRGRYGFSRDSRDATLSNARRVISQVGPRPAQRIAQFFRIA